MPEFQNLTDNTCSKDVCDNSVWEKLKPYDDVPLKDLRKNNPDLLVFPPDLGDNDDDIGEQSLFSLSGGKIRTGNLVGYFGVNGVPFAVRSRFDSSEKQFFLHYLLQKVAGINILNLSTTVQRDDLWKDLYSLLFPYCLKNALRQGLFKAYRHFDYNDSHLRGAIDITRHLRENTPFRGSVSYRTRERTADNALIQLVRHTIEFIRADAKTASVLTGDKDTRDAVNDIVFATPSYARGDREKVVAQNLRPVRHPYFTEYAFLQKLCLKILRRESLSFGASDEKIHGIVFDAAWLWEEYLATVLKDVFTHSRNKTKENGVSVYQDNDGRSMVYPDFYSKEKGIVIDAKYKKLDKGVFRDDRFQLISYMYLLKADKGFLVYPYPRNKNETGAGENEGNIGEDEGNIAEAQTRTLNGYGGKIGRIPFFIPQTEDEKTFIKDIKQTEEDFQELMSAENIESLLKNWPFSRKRDTASSEA